MKKVLTIVSLMILSSFSFAEYNDNVSRKITEVVIYTDIDAIYFKLESPPEHAVCSNAYFVISGSVSIDRRQMLLSRLLVAYTTQEIVNIGYDNAGNCLSGYVQVHRVG